MGLAASTVIKTTISGSNSSNLTALERTGRGVLLVLRPDGTLGRTVTDGDLRRAALGHMGEAMPLGTLPEQAPVTIGQDLPVARYRLQKNGNALSELYPAAPDFKREVKEVVQRFQEQATSYEKLSAFLNIPFDREKAEREFNNLYQIKQNQKH